MPPSATKCIHRYSGKFREALLVYPIVDIFLVVHGDMPVPISAYFGTALKLLPNVRQSIQITRAHSKFQPCHAPLFERWKVLGTL